jgi:uncharacterized protein
MREASLNSVAIKSIDRPAVESAVNDFAGKLLRSRKGVKSVIWFGSWINGNPVPGSDVDICLILKSSKKRFRDRIPDFLPGRFPTGLDLFPYTADEFETLAEEHPAWHRAIASGRTFRRRGMKSSQPFRNNTTPAD